MRTSWIGGCCATRLIEGFPYNMNTRGTPIPQWEEFITSFIGSEIRNLTAQNHNGGAHMIQVNVTNHQSNCFPILESLGFKLVQQYWNGRYAEAGQGASLMHIYQLIVGDEYVAASYHPRIGWVADEPTR